MMSQIHKGLVEEVNPNGRVNENFQTGPFSSPEGYLPSAFVIIIAYSDTKLQHILHLVRGLVK
jgi:hypothetical protein